MKNKFLNTTIQSKRRSLLRTMAISSALVIGLNFLLLIPALNDIEQRIFAHQLEVAEKISLEFQQLFADGAEQDIHDFSIELKEEENELVYVADDAGRIISHYSPSKIGFLLPDDIKLRRGANSSKYAYKFFSHKDVGAQKFQAVSLLIEPMNFTVVVEEDYGKTWGSWYRFLAVSLIGIFAFVALILFLARNTLRIFNLSRQLTEEKEQTASIVSNLEVGIIEYDTDFRILLINPKAQQFLGVSESKVLEKIISSDSMKDSQLQSIAQVLYPALASNIKKICIRDGECKTMELKLEAPFELELQVETIPIHDKDKNIYRYLKVLRDVSRENAIAKSKSEFISVAAHQLRTPLSAIKWVFKMLLDGDAGSINNEQQMFLQKGYQSNERIIQLVTDMLDVARIEEGRFGFEFYYADVINIIKKAMEAFQVKAIEKNIKLTLESPPNPIKPIKVDPTRIELALQNLIDNALKYTLSGGDIIVKVELAGSFVQISIKDSGVGIPDGQEKKLFTKFFRGTNAVKIQTEGTGLGLFITRNIILRHGGKIWAETKEGKGSIFYFTLPIDEKLIPPVGAVVDEFMEGL